MTLSERLLRLATCPKCGEFVTLDNNGALFDLLVRQQPHPQPLIALATLQAFHLLPVEKQGKVACIGSPSRAQYLVGQSRDARPWVIYCPEKEPIKRAAFAQMQELCNLMSAILK